MAELTTVPTFTFKQGEYNEADFELPIRVEYYIDGLICLETEYGSVTIRKENLKKLLKEIEKHLPAAEASLKNRK